MPLACFLMHGYFGNCINKVLWINTGGTETKNIKNRSPSAKNQFQ